MKYGIFIRTDPAGNIKSDKEKITEKMDGGGGSHHGTESGNPVLWQRWTVAADCSIYVDISLDASVHNSHYGRFPAYVITYPKRRPNHRIVHIDTCPLWFGKDADGFF